MGRDDSDYRNPEAEAAAIVGLPPTGLGRYEMIENAGHYLHAQYPQQVADAIPPFLAEQSHASRGLNTSEAMASGAEFAAGIASVTLAVFA